VTLFGIHANAQGKSLPELIALWRRADELGFHWISISDHFPGALGPTSNEAVVSQTAMAYNTKRATCGVLVYCICFRHPAVLATAVTAVDQVSGGRAALGIGAGSLAGDFEIYGFPFPAIDVRMDMLEEGVRGAAGLLRGETVTFQGRHFQFTGAANGPKPVQERLPVWVGTAGERRGLRIVAEYADGWNCTGMSLSDYIRKHEVLRRHCQVVGRLRSEIRTSINLTVGIGDGAEHIPPSVRAHAITGTTAQVVNGALRYVEAGADQINFALPYPWDLASVGELACALELEAG
jgi:alkanesulfonate monooxygenase SsuD/methylene tetrahydromethanopterin reductase-like flavin-dependent oxidoreductase (luciferase family)